MTKIIDLFGYDTSAERQPNWHSVVAKQSCPFLEKRCYKVRKSQPDISIGTCTVEYRNGPIIICPVRLLERQLIFTDCLHLLSHEPGNELHLVSEIGVPGGSIDYVLVSVREERVRDFVGIELQTLDTTGTVWPERQRFLKSKGYNKVSRADVTNTKSFGMNWKMTAKTILVQLHHKIRTFEEISKHLVLVVQDRLLAYMTKEFSFGHLSEPRLSDPMHFHSYTLNATSTGHKLFLTERMSTDTAGIAKCLGLQTEAKVELDVIQKLIENKLTANTLFRMDRPPPAASVQS